MILGKILRTAIRIKVHRHGRARTSLIFAVGKSGRVSRLFRNFAVRERSRHTVASVET